MLVLKRFAIFSLKGLDYRGTLADREEDSTSYRLEHLKAILNSKGYGYKIVKGAYKGTFETSVLVVCDTDEKLNWVRDIAFKDGQESILIVNEDRRAYLEYNPNRTGGYKTFPEELGTFQYISALQASSLENWTLDGSDYYACI